MNALTFPTQDDINSIYRTAPFQPFRNMNARIFTRLHKDETSSDPVTGWFKSIEAAELFRQLHYRVMDVAKSDVLLSYFFAKGIPDDEWYLSPGRRGESVEYFPHFEPIHFAVKDWFDYYANAFYYHLFSALDTVGHVLNVQYELGVRKVYFAPVVDKLCTKNTQLYQALQQIKEDPVFREAHRLRKDIAHNYLPNSTGLSVTWETGDGWEGITVGIRDYTPSAVIMSNVRHMVGLLESVVTLVTE